MTTQKIMDISKKEQEVLEYWDKINAFKKSIEQRPKDRSFVFYDGPPFATGLPHYGHLVPGTMKDVIPRYKTMRGYRVERKWGWDCHGLPVENLIEEELDLKSKKDIEDFGVDKFNQTCCDSVLRYAKEWKETVRRTGRWVDMENSYHTMDPAYMESIWWVFKQLWEKGLIYEGYKSMHVCPRCETPLSNFEVALGYRDVEDPTVTLKFILKDVPENLISGAQSKPTYLLAWTTTPWTLPGNMFLVVNPEEDYVAIEFEDEILVLARQRYIDEYESKMEAGKQIQPYIKGTQLVGLKYAPLFPYFKDHEGAFKVLSADFVTMEDGTGIVHAAPAFGEDDLILGQKQGVELIQHVKMDGTFIDEVTDFKGRFIKEADKDIVEWLKTNNKLFDHGKVEHSYPFCWRCDSPLMNYATSSWFVKVTEIKEQLLKQNQEINWVPEHLKDGRFGKWLEGVRDWAISRNRFWGAPLPVWRSEDGDVLVIGSQKELEELSGQKVEDLHKQVVDKVVIEKDGKKYYRIPEVLDCWFESGSMPYGQAHYPFENKEWFEENYPADFIAEAVDQTRGWFYTLHVLGTALFGKPAFRNVAVNGLVMAEDGKKMSKRLKNYPEPMEIIEKYGADAMRYYLLSSPVVRGENLNFSEKGVDEVYKKVILITENVLSFLQMYSSRHPERNEVESKDPPQGTRKSEHVLDKWIMARLHQLIKEVTEAYESYDLQGAARPVQDFVNDLSTWYLRRSRGRFKEEGEDKLAAVNTLQHVLLELSKVCAPIMPFISERIYQSVIASEAKQSRENKESVHLDSWPEFEESLIDEALLKQMKLARKVVELGLAARAEAALKVRQPLQYIRYQTTKLSDELEQIIAEELNVKEVKHTEEVREQDDRVVKEDGGVRIGLNTTITPELKSEGIARELVRQINGARKKAGLTIQDIIPIQIYTTGGVKSAFDEHKESIKKQTLAKELILAKKEETSAAECEIEKEKLQIWFEE